jgi:hypothetical protein
VAPVYKPTNSKKLIMGALAGPADRDNAVQTQIQMRSMEERSLDPSQWKKGEDSKQWPYG